MENQLPSPTSTARDARAKMEAAQDAAIAADYTKLAALPRSLPPQEILRTPAGAESAGEQDFIAGIIVTGNTYPAKDQLKALGARWNG